MVRAFEQVFTPSGSRSNEITWDGTADNGARLPSGIYVYKMNIKTSTGSQTTAYQKLVLVR
jgi:flagellar hook assembly protein FlgD